jgi:mannose-6-phosphate isomerase-like protein (cupin superfamily)
MSKTAIVSEEMAKKFATEKDTPYLRWVRNEGLDIIAAHYVPNLRTVELKPWARRGGSGVYINHEASRTSNDCYVCEIPPGKSLAPQRQMFEEMIMVLEGRGSTSVWNDAGKKVTFEWGPGALFAIPLNAWHQHFNGSGQNPARYVAVTNGSQVMNQFDDGEFVFNTAYDFKNRFSGEPDYFSGKGEQKGLLMETNFVADAVNLPLIEAKERGAGGGHIRFQLAKSSMNSHISQFPVGTYKKCHRHGPGDHAIGAIEPARGGLAVEVGTAKQVGGGRIEGGQAEQIAGGVDPRVEAMCLQPVTEQVAGLSVFRRGGQPVQTAGWGGADA